MRTHGQQLEKSSISAISLISNKTGFARALQSLHHYITVPHITSHANTHTFVFNVWQDTYLWITQCQNKETRSTPVKEGSLTKNPVELKELLFPREDHTRSLPFESNSFYESSLFPLGNPFDQFQPTFSH